MGPFGAAFTLASLLVFLFYPLSGKMHKKVLEALKLHSEGKPAVDPLTKKTLLPPKLINWYAYKSETVAAEVEKEGLLSKVDEENGAAVSINANGDSTTVTFSKLTDKFGKFSHSDDYEYGGSDEDKNEDVSEAFLGKDHQKETKDDIENNSEDKKKEKKKKKKKHHRKSKDINLLMLKYQEEHYDYDYADRLKWEFGNFSFRELKGVANWGNWFAAFVACRSFLLWTVVLAGKFLSFSFLLASSFYLLFASSFFISFSFLLASSFSFYLLFASSFFISSSRFPEINSNEYTNKLTKTNKQTN